MQLTKETIELSLGCLQGGLHGAESAGRAHLASGNCVWSNGGGGGEVTERWEMEGIWDLSRRPEGIVQVKRYVRDLPGGCSQAAQEPNPHPSSPAHRSAPLRRGGVREVSSDRVGRRHRETGVLSSYVGWSALGVGRTLEVGRAGVIRKAEDVEHRSTAPSVTRSAARGAACMNLRPSIPTLGLCLLCSCSRLGSKTCLKPVD